MVQQSTCREFFHFPTVRLEITQVIASKAASSSQDKRRLYARATQTCNTAGNNTVSHNATSILCVTTTEVLANRAADTNGDKICIGNGTAAVCSATQTCNTAGNNTVSHNATSSLCVTTTEVLANRAADTNGDKICIGNGTADVCSATQTCNAGGTDASTNDAATSLCVTTTAVLANRAVGNAAKICIGNGTAAVCSATQTCNTAGTNGSSHDAASGVCVAPEEEEDGEFGGIEIFLILLLCFAVFAVAAVLVYFYWGSSDENMDKSGENKDGEKKDDDKKKPDENTDKKKAEEKTDKKAEEKTDKKKAEEKTDKKAEEKTDKKKADKKTDKKTAEEDVDLERAEGKVEDTGV